jgi:hypothetical protein
MLMRLPPRAKARDLGPLLFLRQHGFFYCSDPQL